MALVFRWDPRKAKANLAKHQISFEEASSAFGDPLSITIEDVGHSRGEIRYILLGETLEYNLVVVVHTERNGEIRIISARLALDKSGDHMKPAKLKAKDDQMRAEYDFSKGVRGKYSKLFAKGTNIVVLDPDVAKVFKTSKEVNSILRTLTKIAAQKAK